MAKIPINAWREITTQIFDGFEVEYNVIPAWLVNPATRRRLKLDLLYPEIGVAIRFQGLKARYQSSRVSDQERQEEIARDQARQQLCEEHGVSLAGLNLSVAELESIFIELETAMSRASRQLAKDSARPPAEKAPLLERLSQARNKTAQFRRDIKTDSDLNLYAELWQDRQYRDAAAPDTPPATPPPPLRPGMMVEHNHFGIGEVTAVTPGPDDTLVTIDFAEAGERTFMASLLAGKVMPL